MTLWLWGHCLIDLLSRLAVVTLFWYKGRLTYTCIFTCTCTCTCTCTGTCTYTVLLVHVLPAPVLLLLALVWPKIPGSRVAPGKVPDKTDMDVQIVRPGACPGQKTSRRGPEKFLERPQRCPREMEDNAFYGTVSQSFQKSAKFSRVLRISLGTFAILCKP